MMRLVRIAAVIALVFALLFGAAAALIAVNQARIVVYVLASVHNRTGVQIIPRSSSVHLSTHLIVDLDQPTAGLIRISSAPIQNALSQLGK